ncbi:hypothetical protein NL676_029601 [Syzygium grande]|nr:hypothetical protein NL676_029601 [Syzygium grande]
MGSGRGGASSERMDSSVAGLQQKHQHDLENLTLTAQPFKTFKFFTLAVIQYVQRSMFYLLRRGGWLLLLSTVAVALGVLLVTFDGPHEKHVEELSEYIQFGLWWIALGVASSIGLGSGLHTFVLYLGPHIALFTIKAMQCGRVDLKTAPYDTIQLKRVPSWLDKDCSDFGPAMFTLVDGLRVPLSSILPQVQIEAVLWGIGTALGELPPYFISRAAQLSGSRIDPMEDLDVSTMLASVPNPLFDLAGIMCGQFGIPFWEFFLATLIGKAVIKTHIQTVFIISVCNNQLLNWIENELIWALSFIPGLASILPNLIAKLSAVRDKYLTAPPPVPSNVKVKKWDFSFASIWNSIVWLMLLNFFIKIVTSTAQSYLKKQQEKELDDLKNRLSTATNSN